VAHGCAAFVGSFGARDGKAPGDLIWMETPVPDGRMPWQDVDRPESSAPDSPDVAPVSDPASTDRPPPTSSQTDPGQIPGTRSTSADHPSAAHDEMAPSSTSAARRQLLEEASQANAHDQVDFETASPKRTLTSLWPIPAIALSCALIGLGLYLTLVHEPPVSISEVLRQAGSHLDQGELQQTTTLLRGSVEPRLNEATVIERATYSRLVGD